jgi:hypothetical protein
MTIPPRSLSDVLQATAEELSQLSCEADQLGGLGIADVERWQALDRMSQYLNGMSLFLSHLAGTVHVVAPDLSDALALLTTSALAARLAGTAGRDEEDAGALELFDA